MGITTTGLRCFQGESAFHQTAMLNPKGRMQLAAQLGHSGSSPDVGTLLTPRLAWEDHVHTEPAKQLTGL